MLIKIEFKYKKLIQVIMIQKVEIDKQNELLEYRLGLLARVIRDEKVCK